MAVFRVNKNKNYTVMCNYHFKDKSLSLKAKGLLSQMLSLPDDWDYTIAGLCAINKEKESSIKSALSELKKQGYLKVTKFMPNQTESGRIEYRYDIYEFPCQYTLNQDVENQDVEKQGIENQHVENPRQLNTNISSTNKQSTNKEKTKDIDTHAKICAEKLKDKILDIYPNNVGARKLDCIDRWAKDIEKMHRIDGRSWQNIEEAIDWAMSDSFWQQNIWSGASLRKHYDKLEAGARAMFLKNGVITVGV